VNGGILSSSNIEKCVKDGATEEFLTECDSKLVALMSVTSGQNGTEYLHSVLLASTKDEDGTVQQLERPVRIRIFKSEVYATYAMYYVQHFNNRPFETTYQTSNIFKQCSDSPSSSSPTCGWVRDSSGNVIEDSQGFCCSCSIQDSINIIADPGFSRGNDDCLFDIAASSSHCLRFDQLWYSGFELREPFLTYEVTVVVEQDMPDGSIEKVRKKAAREGGRQICFFASSCLHLRVICLYLLCSCVPRSLSCFLVQCGNVFLQSSCQSFRTPLLFFLNLCSPHSLFV